MSNIAPLPPLDVSLDVFLSKEWIEQALKFSGVIAAGERVASVKAEPLTGGFMADTYRLTLDYSSPDLGAPRSIVAKFPSSNPGSRAVGAEQLSYAREVYFYKLLAPQFKIMNRFLTLAIILLAAACPAPLPPISGFLYFSLKVA